MNCSREKRESMAFDKFILDQREQENESNLLISNSILKKHLNLKCAPLSAYRLSLYLLFDNDVKDENILNIACGTGYESVILAQKGASVFAFDISQESIRIAKKRAILNKVHERIRFEVMSVYDIKYPSESFKYIYGSACLHHFELEKALHEIKRVLKKGGKAVFYEPFAGSKRFQRIRNCIPIKRNIVSPDERQLNYDDVRIIKQFFKNVKVTEVGFLVRLNRLIRSELVLDVIYQLDNFLIKKIPLLGKYARNIVIEIKY